MPDTQLELVISVGARFGLSINAEVAGRIKHFIDQLCHWGQRINLTSRPEALTLIERHLPDAFQLVASLQSRAAQALQNPDGPPYTCVDFGSGAGLPAIPLAICLPAIKLSLVEPHQKKCTFLKTICHELQLTVNILPQRMEQVSLPLQDLVCSRATWSPEEWLTRARSWVKPGGSIVVFVAHPYDLPPCPAPLHLTETLPYQLMDGAPRLMAYYSMPLAPDRS